jgi:hypothetical protein
MLKSELIFKNLILEVNIVYKRNESGYRLTKNIGIYFSF